MTVCEAAAHSVQRCVSCDRDRVTCQWRHSPETLTASQTGDDKLWPGVTRRSDALLQWLGRIMEEIQFGQRSLCDKSPYFDIIPLKHLLLLIVAGSNKLLALFL